MRYQQIISEIREKSAQPGHRAAYDIYQLLNNNKQHFKDKIDKEDLKVLLKDLETLSESNPANYHTSMYKREAEQVLGRLLFYLERIV